MQGWPVSYPDPVLSRYKCEETVKKLCKCDGLRQIVCTVGISIL